MDLYLLFVLHLGRKSSYDRPAINNNLTLIVESYKKASSNNQINWELLEKYFRFISDLKIFAPKDSAG